MQAKHPGRLKLDTVRRRKPDATMLQGHGKMQCVERPQRQGRDAIEKITGVSERIGRPGKLADGRVREMLVEPRQNRLRALVKQFARPLATTDRALEFDHGERADARRRVGRKPVHEIRRPRFNEVALDQSGRVDVVHGA